MNSSLLLGGHWMNCGLESKGEVAGFSPCPLYSGERAGVRGEVRGHERNAMSNRTSRPLTPTLSPLGTRGRGGNALNAPVTWASRQRPRGLGGQCRKLVGRMPTLLVGLLSIFCLNFAPGDTVISVVPRPVSISPPNNPYELTDGMTIATREPELEPIARFLADALTKKTGLGFRVTKDVGNILLLRDAQLTQPSSYNLVSVKGDIGINGADAAGVF